jgi:DNA-binding LacI/PurR family transcriptional regulator
MTTLSLSLTTALDFPVDIAQELTNEMSVPPGGNQNLRVTNRPLHVTLQDVATLAGVSAKTVSRVVNNQGEIKEATRLRVQAAIDELGYRPNFLARSLVHQRSNTLAVVAWGIEYFGPSRTVVGIERQASELGYSLFLNLMSEPDGSSHERVMNDLLAHRVDGIIWAVPEVGDNRTWIKSDRLKQLPPMVFLNMATQPGFAIVSVDNQNGGKQATRHLIDGGRRKIGIIAGPQKWWEARERYLGWKNTLEQAGLEPSPSLVVESHWSAADGEKAMVQLLRQEPDIDAVFAGSDQIALGAMRAILASGRRIPQDVAIVGFDNIPESSFFGPPLTTVYQHLIEVGRTAVLNLHRMIKDYREGRESAEATVTVSEPELLVRASTMET